MKSNIAGTAYRSMPPVLLPRPAILNPLPTVQASSQGSVSSSFDIGTRPTVTAATLTPRSMVPQARCSIIVSINPNANPNTLDNVMLKLCHDFNGGTSPLAKSNNVSPNARDCAASRLTTWGSFY